VSSGVGRPFLILIGLLGFVRGARGWLKPTPHGRGRPPTLRPERHRLPDVVSLSLVRERNAAFISFRSEGKSASSSLLR